MGPPEERHESNLKLIQSKPVSQNVKMERLAHKKLSYFL
jgi:hypothetical protein